MKPFRLYKPPMDGPKALFLDIEISAHESYTWGIWNQNVAINQIKKDPYLLSWAAKWLNHDDSKIMQQDSRKRRDPSNDKPILEDIWSLVDDANILITHNGRNFDLPFLKYRWEVNNFPVETSVKHIDTLQIARRHFRFPSNKLEYIADRLGVKFKKDTHSEFPGFELWRQCMNANKKAWPVLAEYNKNDIKTLEGVYERLIPHDTKINFYIYTDKEDFHCRCGSTEFVRNGYTYARGYAYQRFVCKRAGCRTEYKDNKKGKREPVSR